MSKRLRIAAIYRIEYKGKFYVGSSMDVYTRIRGHVASLKRGTHSCTKLLRTFNENGKDLNDLTFSILHIPEMYTYNDLLKLEAYYIGVNDSINNGYNNFIADIPGNKRKFERLLKFSELANNYSKTNSEEARIMELELPKDILSDIKKQKRVGK